MSEDTPNTPLKPETIVLHEGYRAEQTTGAVAVPIYQTTAYQFDSVEHAAGLFSLSKFGNIYTRLMNPTVDVLEKRVAALEGGVAAVALSSGQAASAHAVQNLVSAGDNIVCSTDIYGGTWNLFKNTLGRLGVETRFVNPEDPENFAKATDDRTRAYYGETIPNPKLKVFPISEVADIGRPLGIPLIVDNTVSPILTRPFDHGAAIVVYSLTKYIGGHGTTLGGAIVDSGTFDWSAVKSRQPALNEPDESYHGTIWTEAVKSIGPIAYALRIRTNLLRDMGAPLSPMAAFQILQGLETLPLRMREHCRNAAAVADFLKAHPAVSSVIYPKFHNGKVGDRARKYLNGGFGGLVGFELKNGIEGGVRFINALKLLYHVANIGDARSLAIHPASTTHSQLTDEERLASGVAPGYVRLSIGIEHIDDILADMSQALKQAL